MNGAGMVSALLVALACLALREAGPARGRGAARARLRREHAGGPSCPQPDLLTLHPVAPSWIAKRLADAGLTMEPLTAWRLWLASLGLLVAAAGTIGGIGGAVVAGGVGAVGPLLGWRLLRRRGADRLEAALPGAVDAIARSLRSGASLRLALVEAAAATPAPVGTELASVARAVDRGATVVVALEAWAEHRPSEGVRLVVSALCLGAETGGARARAVDGVAATLRQRLSVRAEARALATQARASAAVIAAAPVAFTAVSSATDARTAAFLFRTPAGLLCLTAGLALDAAGALWMARLTRIDVGS